MGQRKVSFKIKHSFFYCFKALVSLNNSTHARAHCEFEKFVRSFAQEKKSQQAPEIDYGVHLRTKIIENKIQFEVQKLDYPYRNFVI